jgi:hypothetical protein
MPQGPIASAAYAKNFATGLSQPQLVDASGLHLTTNGGTTATYNLTTATVIKATPGRMARITIVNAGTTGGSFTLNDCATTGAAAASNEIWSVAFNGSGVVAGASFLLDWPCATGIVLSAVPSGGTPIVSVSWS